MAYNFGDQWMGEAWMEAFIEMQANPFDHATLGEFCEQWKITRNDLAAWRNKNKQKIAMEFDKRRPAFRQALRTEAMKQVAKRMSKSDKVLELTFRLLGDLVEKREERIETLTPEDKRLKVKAMLEALSNKMEPQSEAGPEQPKQSI